MGIVLFLIFIKPIEYFFEKKPSKEKIFFLQKEAEENNLTALSKLVIFYKKEGNDKMLKKYFSKYKLLVFCYDSSYKDMCSNDTIIIKK